MKNSKLIIAAIIIAIFALTSCQKDNMSELAQNTITTSSRTTPEINVVNEDVKTQFTLAMGKTSATSRNSNTSLLDKVSCSSGTHKDSTIGSDNYFDAINSPCLDGKGDAFDGPDKSFPFIVGTSPGEIVQHTIILREMEQDLDLFIFALDSDGRVGECVATSITHGLEDEVIELTDLAPGYYEIVVDGWNKEIQSTFELAGYCSSIVETPEEEANTLVNNVIIGFDQNIAFATMVQVSADEWMMMVTETGETSNGTEIDRDGFNIYLKFENDVAEYQLNLNSKEVMKIDEDGQVYVVATILEASEQINGYLANTITLGKDGQTIGKFYKEFNITDNRIEWKSAGQTEYFFNPTPFASNIYMTTSNGLARYNFDFDQMKVIIQTENFYDEVYDILSVE